MGGVFRGEPKVRHVIHAQFKRCRHAIQRLNQSYFKLRIQHFQVFRLNGPQTKPNRQVTYLFTWIDPQITHQEVQNHRLLQKATQAKEGGRRNQDLQRANNPERKTQIPIDLWNHDADFHREVLQKLKRDNFLVQQQGLPTDFQGLYWVAFEQEPRHLCQ